MNKHSKNPVYIQRRAGKVLETVDECDTHKEAKELLTEYRLSDPVGN